MPSVAPLSVALVHPDMKVRGERECRSCGTRWSYYETGEITCPECGSVRSVGTDERTEHTDGAAEFDLTAVRNLVDEQPLREIADQAAEVAGAYLRSAGFVNAGIVQPLDDTYVAAAELRRVGATLGRVMDHSVDEEAYVLALLRGADAGERPDPDDVPETFHPERGLAIAAAIDAYMDDLRRVRDETQRFDNGAELDRAISVVRTHRKRIEALDGNIDPTVAEQLLRAARDIGRSVREGDENALGRVFERLED